MQSATTAAADEAAAAAAVAAAVAAAKALGDADQPHFSRCLCGDTHLCPLAPADPAALEGVVALGGGTKGGVDRRLWRKRWLLYRQGVTGWSALVAVAFSVLGWS
ncbi:hypothetical protein B0T24DRAFT_679643 [Lasiosphaeria ovina]|uniref:Uncharacterized protein n=1 Tax=Lasiosphaeria ovina TaxID=92902 RepID=A0AAE0KCP1_9PEZI|nr:hypothetical protein B0T24DRAFT_679643 [Lasiosphaeria ovina]